LADRTTVPLFYESFWKGRFLFRKNHVCGDVQKKKRNRVFSWVISLGLASSVEGAPLLVVWAERVAKSFRARRAGGRAGGRPADGLVASSFFLLPFLTVSFFFRCLLIFPLSILSPCLFTIGRFLDFYFFRDGGHARDGVVVLRVVVVVRRSRMGGLQTFYARRPSPVVSSSAGNRNFLARARIPLFGPLSILGCNCERDGRISQETEKSKRNGKHIPSIPEKSCR
jgi:hypothetical protein